MGIKEELISSFRRLEELKQIVGVSDKGVDIGGMLTLAGVTVPRLKSMINNNNICYHCMTSQIMEYAKSEQLKNFIVLKLLPIIENAKTEREKFIRENANAAFEARHKTLRSFRDESSVNLALNQVMLIFLKNDVVPGFTEDLLTQETFRTALVELGAFPDVVEAIDKDIENLKAIIPKFHKDVEALEEIC